MSPSFTHTLSDLSLEAMQALARGLGERLAPGDVVTLKGELGAGKTSFARALISAIAPDSPTVTSPTFTLMQSYDVTLKGGVRDVLWHLDLYRLKDAQELEALGLDELWSHVVLMEWPEIAADYLPEGCLTIDFAFGDLPDTRTLTFRGNDAWRGRLAGLT